MNKLRWGKFYWSDWADDPALALCSLAAQGFWMRLLCIAAQGTPYGHVTVNGMPPSTDDLAKLIRPKPKTETVIRLIAELERRGVAFRGDCGCLVSRRMESDGILAGIRADAAKSRWNKGLDKDLHMQNGDFASIESTETHESRIPPNPPRGKRGGRNNGGGGRQASRNASADILAEEIYAAATDTRPSGASVVSLTQRAIGR